MKEIVRSNTPIPGCFVTLEKNDYETMYCVYLNTSTDDIESDEPVIKFSNIEAANGFIKGASYVLMKTAANLFLINPNPREEVKDE